MTIIMNLYIEQMEQSIHPNYAFKVVFVQFAYCRNHVAIDRILTFFYLILESVWFFDGTDQAVLRSFSTVLFFGTLIYYFWGRGTVQKLFWSHLIQTNNFCFQSIALFLLYPVVLSLQWCVVWVVVPIDQLVSTQLQCWLFCFWSCGCCWAVTIYTIQEVIFFYKIKQVHPV